MHALYPLYGREVIPLVRELLKEEAGAVPEVLTWQPNSDDHRDCTDNAVHASPIHRTARSNSPIAN
jgi:hypothetical protein